MLCVWSNFLFTVCRNVFNPIALRKAKIAYKFGLSKCGRVKYRVVPL